MSGIPYLTVLILVPFAGALVTASLGKRLAKYAALAFGLGGLVLAIALWHGFHPSLAGLQFEERYAWIPALNTGYHLGVDGLGVLLVLLSAILTPMAIAASWQFDEPLYFSLMLAIEGALFGTFTALNFVHWFLFWELVLIPAFFLIKLWGGARRGPAALQFFVYTMVGSATLLLAFAAIFVATGSFDFIDLAAMARSGQLEPLLAARLAGHGIPPGSIAFLIFAGAFLGFAIKVPLVPFHTWLPSAYAEAPSGTTMLLTGALSKMGLYGFLRILLPIFPQQMHAAAKPLLWLAVATIVLPALTACVQKDLKRIFAYSSINHLGYCLLAIFAVAGRDSAGLASQRSAALDGAFLQMFNHGLTAATLFWFVALIEKRSGGLRGLDDFGGIRKVAPVLCGLMGIALFSSLGLPGLNGFVGEFLIFKGVFPLAPWAAAVSLLGLLLTAVFLLTILERVFSGPLSERWKRLPDLAAGERLALAPAIGLMFLLGLIPQLVLAFVNGAAMRLAQLFGS